MTSIVSAPAVKSTFVISPIFLFPVERSVTEKQAYLSLRIPTVIVPSFFNYID